MPDQPQPSARIVAEPRWDVYYAVVFVASLAIVQAAPAQVSQRIIATAALAAMVPWYLFLGRPLMTQDQPATRKATVDLAGLVVLFAIAQSQAANAWVLAFGLLPMCFHVMTARRAMVFVVIINVIGAGLDAWRNPGLAGALIALGIAAFAIAFAYVYSRWMARVIEQSLDRAALIEQLEATGPNSPRRTTRPASRPNGTAWPARSTTPWRRGSPASSPCSRPARPASTPPAPPAATSTWRCSPRARTWPRPGPWSPRSPRPRWRRARSATPCAG